MSLTKKEFDELVDLICDIVNTSNPDLDYDNPLCDKNLFNKLDKLLLKYGELPDLLCIRADFIDSIDERLKLYKRAIELSKTLNDFKNLTQSAESITLIYIEEQPDYDNAYKWFNKLESWVSEYGDEYITIPLSETKSRIMRLKIHSVS